MVKTFIQLKTYVENMLNEKIKILQSDNGGEYTSTSFKHYLLLHGIDHQFTCPHTSEQNGVSERKHRHVLDLSRVLFSHSHVPFYLWDEIFSTTIFLINRLPLKVSNNISPFEKLFFKPPDYLSLRIFWCECYPWLRPYTTSKLQARSKISMFLGYSLNHKGYKCFDPITGNIIMSRHVSFNE